MFEVFSDAVINGHRRPLSMHYRARKRDCFRCHIKKKNSNLQRSIQTQAHSNSNQLLQFEFINREKDPVIFQSFSFQKFREKQFDHKPRTCLSINSFEWNLLCHTDKTATPPAKTGGSPGLWEMKSNTLSLVEGGKLSSTFQTLALGHLRVTLRTQKLWRFSFQKLTGGPVKSSSLPETSMLISWI